MQNVAEIELERPAIRRARIALPVEHGSWGFLFEPLVASSAIAFSTAALPIAVMVIGAFMVRRPLQIYIIDRLSGRILPQTRIAFRFAFAFFTIFVLGSIAAVLTAPRSAFLPLAVATPLAIYQLYCDIRRKNRELAAELAGGVVMSSSAATIALAGGFEWPMALAVWIFFVARFVPSILYVRDRLRLEKGKQFSFAIPVSAHLIGLISIVLLWGAGLMPLLTVPVFLVLFLRSAVGLSRFRRPAKAMEIGIWEVVYGGAAVFSLIIGHHTGI